MYPSCASFWCTDYCWATSRRSKGYSIKIVRVLQNMILWELWMCTQGYEHILHIFCLFYEFAPQERGKYFVTRAKACNGVIKKKKITFCCVHMVIVWFYQPYPYFLLFKVFLDCLGSNIVYDVEDGFESSFCQLCYVWLKFEYHWFSLQIFYSCWKYGIGWPVVQHKKFCISFDSSYWEFYCEVNIDCNFFQI